MTTTYMLKMCCRPRCV